MCLCFFFVGVPRRLHSRDSGRTCGVYF